MGWIFVAAVVIGYDGYALRTGKTSTLSSSYRSTYRKYPYLVGAGTVYLITHLTGHLPVKYDALRRIN